METKILKIDIPEGYEIDKEKSTFEKIAFKKIEQGFSKNWKEFCKNNPVEEKEAFIDNSSEISSNAKCQHRYLTLNKNLMPEKFAEPMLALMQLLTIREKEYTKGWEPNWESTNTYYTIRLQNGIIVLAKGYCCGHVLAFPTQKLRDTFYNNWKSLIRIAKPLL